MSVKVDLDQLADALADFTIAYLVTVGDDYRAHTVAVEPLFVDGIFQVGQIGRHTRENSAQHGDVTLIWPPREPGGYTLIVDGTGRPIDDALRVVPTRAVLHRKANDCVPLEK
jgi:hypothetical protein